MSSESSDSATRELLVFEFEGARFGVAASDVDAVVAWVEPVPLPRAGGPIRGVVQDRGRVVPVLRHPSWGEPLDQEDPRRIIVCRTSSGLLGIPATTTRAIAATAILGELVPGVIETDQGTLTFVAPEATAERIVGSRRAREAASPEVE